MREALIQLITLLQSEIYTPVGEALRSSSWVQNLFTFLNTLLSKITDAFHDAPSSTGITNFFTFDFVSSIITTFILIWFISLIVKIFKLSFQTLKKLYLSIIETGTIEKGSSKTWRKQWRRKK